MTKPRMGSLAGALCALTACSPANTGADTGAQPPSLDDDAGSRPLLDAARVLEAAAPDAPLAADGASAPDGEARDGAVPDAADSAAPIDAATPRRGFPAASDPTMPGPFPTEAPSGTAEGPNCVVHRPKTLGAGGTRHPVIIWGMGTGGFNTYQAAFELWASHGFIVAASLLGDGQGDGAEMLACLSHVCSAYADHVDCRAAATGHSQGGGGAIMAGMDPRVVATAPIQPYIQQGFGGFDQGSISRQQGPMLLFSGTNDVVASPEGNQRPVFEDANVPVFWANLVNGEHVSTGLDGAAGYRSAALAWFRLQLLDDPDYAGTFYGPRCALCSDPAWIVKTRGL